MLLGQQCMLGGPPDHQMTLRSDKKATPSGMSSRKALSDHDKSFHGVPRGCNWWEAGSRLLTWKGILKAVEMNWEC